MGGSDSERVIANVVNSVRNAPKTKKLTSSRGGPVSTKSVVAIIPAKGGSKRLRRKNIAVIAGKPLIAYAIENAKEEVKPFLKGCHAKELPFDDNSFDLVVSINTLHNLYCYELESALREIERVAKKNKYICVESYRNEKEKVNFLYWQVTCEMFCTPEEWKWWFDLCDYTGDNSFIYFE